MRIWTLASMRLLGIMLLLGVTIHAVTVQDWGIATLAVAFFLVAGGFKGLFEGPL